MICSVLTNVAKKDINNSQVEYSIFDSIKYVPEYQWNIIIPEDNDLMKYAYLKAIENSSSEFQKSKYVLFYKDSKLVGAAIFNIIFINGEDYNGKKSEFPYCPMVKLKESIKKRTKLKVLICGHTHISGNHGFVYSAEIDSTEAYISLSEIMEKIKNSEKKNGVIHLLLIKDFYDNENKYANQLLNFNYRQFKVDPNMILAINKDWKNFDDYLISMKTKYRTKAKAIVQKSSNLHRITFSKEDIILNSDKIQELYNNVAEKAKFKMNKYDVNYFIELKSELQENYEFIGYFEEDKLIAFSTRIMWGINCEAHSVGIDYLMNSKYDLYMNILYDNVKAAIFHERKNLILGRTAMEMKSNIGAVPLDMWCYARFSDSLSNHLVKPFVMKEKIVEWNQRKPFKIDYEIEVKLI